MTYEEKLKNVEENKKKKKSDSEWGEAIHERKTKEVTIVRKRKTRRIVDEK